MKTFTVESAFTRISVSTLLVAHYFFGLILYPYKSMRKITQERDYLQILLIFVLIYGYFIAANIIRKRTLHPFIISTSSLVSFLFFLLTFFITIAFFYSMSRLMKLSTNLQALIFSFAYSLFPSFIWFLTTSVLYYLLPPPRTFSFLGKSFSITFIIFSLTLLIWRIILLYLSLRFSLKANFYTILILIIFFIIWFLPYSFMMYQLKVFRIPFI